MKRLVSLICISMVVVIAAGGIAFGQSRYDKWQASRPFTIGAMYYDAPVGPAATLPPGSAQPDMQIFRGAGLNMIDDVSHSAGGHQDYPGVATAQAAGVPFMILGAGWAGKGAPTALGSFQKHVRFFADDPRWNGFAGVQMADEPRDPVEMAQYRQQRDWLVETYPHLLVAVCEAAGDYEMIERQIVAIRPDAIFYQWYHSLWKVGLEDIWFIRHNEEMSNLCKKHDVSFWITRLTGRERQSESEYRASTFPSLAYGCRGFIDWYYDGGLLTKKSSWPMIGYVNSLDGDKPLLPQYEYLSRINGEVTNLGPALVNLRHVKSFTVGTHEPEVKFPTLFAGDHPGHTGKLKTLAGRTAPDTPGEKDGRLLVGFFRDADEEYFMVVNLNFDRVKHSDHPWLVQRVMIGFADEVEAVERLSRTTGKVERLALEDHKLIFDLPGATGDLFKVATGKPFAGIEPDSGETE